MDERNKPSRHGQGRGQRLGALRHGGADGAKPMLLAGRRRRLVVEGERHAAHALRPADFHGKRMTLRPTNAQGRCEHGLEQQDQSHKARDWGGNPDHNPPLMAAPCKLKPCSAPDPVGRR